MPQRRNAAFLPMLESKGRLRQFAEIIWWNKRKKEILMVTLNEARRVIDAAEKKAQEIGQPMNIAVADARGNLVAHIRMDEAWIGRTLRHMILDARGQSK